MEAEQLKRLERKESAHIAEILDEFNKKNAELLVFDSFHTDNQWHELWLAIFGILEDKELEKVHALCLNTVRILTRDEFSLQTHYIEQELGTLLQLARLDAQADVELLRQLSAQQAEIIAEALKCLCNLVYQSADCRKQCLRQHGLDALVQRLSLASSMRYPTTLEYYDMKLLFLLTALETTARVRLQNELSGLTYMTNWLDEKLSEPGLLQSKEQQQLLCELLKVLFTLTSTTDKSPNEQELQCLQLTRVLRELLLHFGDQPSSRGVLTHAINLLTNINSSCLVELLIKCNPVDASDDVNCFEQRNVRCLQLLLDYLRQGLAQQQLEASSPELLSPVLTVLVKCARSNRIMRHYLRKQILPPLKDVSQRPELGTELRNHLCRFLTLPAMILRDLAAELIFVLCKENVARMIKYTGYGNAAGLFAKRGLLDCRRVENTDYSSDSENSDTEEYKQQQACVNPVLGCVEQPKRNPLEGMSEEQQEYEALQLVKLLEQLRQDGVVQPALIDKDGKPQPLEHILQLQEQ
ncbi:ric8a, partial [Drosophila busckii]